MRVMGEVYLGDYSGSDSENSRDIARKVKIMPRNVLNIKSFDLLAGVMISVLEPGIYEWLHTIIYPSNQPARWKQTHELNHNE